MSDSIKDRITTDFEKVKAQGGTRATRIGEIVRDAASQAITELKAGSGEIGTIAKDTFSSISNNLNEPGQESTEEPTSSGSRTVNLFTILKNRLVVELKSRLITLDATLTSRYGDRYQAVKQRVEKLADQYNNAIANAEAQGSDPLQQKQTEFETKVGEAGTSVARKELQIRQQLKDLLQTAAAKL